MNSYTLWLVLLVVALVERVVGLPILFFGTVLYVLERASTTTRHFGLLGASLVLALLYQTPFLTAFIIVGVGELAWWLLGVVSSSKTARILISVSAMVGALALATDFPLSYRAVIYGAISTLILILETRTSQKSTLRL